MDYQLRGEDVKDLETVFIPGSSTDFSVYIAGLREKATLHSIDGKARWIVEREDGTKVIARPQV